MTDEQEGKKKDGDPPTTRKGRGERAAKKSEALWLLRLFFIPPAFRPRETLRLASAKSYRKWTIADQWRPPCRCPHRLDFQKQP